MIEIRHLKLVATLEKVGSLKKAAKELFLTQSALSHQLKQLEASLGAKIFYRTNNQLSFTPVGKEFCETAKEILVKMDKIELRVQENRDELFNSYIHGYSAEETKRLYDQANSIADFIHWDSKWEEGATILEAGCGVGAQTKIIAAQNPNCQFTSMDISEKSLAVAAKSIDELKLTNVQFLKADLRELSFKKETFDHVFVCFVLEHVKDPVGLLKALKRVLKPNGTITVIEGDHGSTYFYPDSEAARNAVAAQVILQQQNGGNANIGRALYPLLAEAGFQDITNSPRQIYVDPSKPKLVDGFIRNTFTEMIKGIATQAVAHKIISQEEMQKGIQDLYQTAIGGTFCYTFFKGQGKKKH